MKRLTLTLLALAVMFWLATVPIWGQSQAEEPNCEAVQTTASKIAFISDRSRADQIYWMNADGTNVDQLTHLKDAELSDLTWSPDGRFLAFVNTSKTDFNASDIYILDTEIRSITRLTSNPGSDYHPAWLPDGKYIAYISDRGGLYDIWVMRTNGANIVNLTNDPRWEITVAWTPDGTGIVYVPNSGADLELWSLAWTDGFKWNTPFLFGNSPSDPALYNIIDVDWSPDGKRLSIATSREVYLINPDGTDLTKFEDVSTVSPGGIPHWSSDSCRLVFTSNPNGNWQIYTLHLGNKNATRVTEDSANDTDPVWQPNPTKAD